MLSGGVGQTVSGAGRWTGRLESDWVTGMTWMLGLIDLMVQHNWVFTLLQSYTDKFYGLDISRNYCSPGLICQ